MCENYLIKVLCSLCSSKAKKAYIVLTCGPPSTQSWLPKGKGEDGEMCTDSDEDSDDEDQTVRFS